MNRERIKAEREFLVMLAIWMAVFFLAFAGVGAIFGWFVRSVTSLAVAVACAAIVMMLDRTPG